jgi:hypothetical protein
MSARSRAMRSAQAVAALVDPGQALRQPSPASAVRTRSRSAQVASRALFQAGVRSAENAQANLQPEYSEQQLVTMLAEKRSQQTTGELAAAQASTGHRQAALGAALEAAVGACATGVGPDGVPEGKHEDILPTRNLEKQEDARLVGGAARLPARLAAIGRSFLDTKEIAPSEFSKFGQGLNMGSQVPHTSTLASLVGWGAGPESQSSPLLSTLQHGGLARREGSGAEALLGSIFNDIHSRAKKDIEKDAQPAIKDFQTFFKQLIKLNVLAPALAYTSPQTYWAMDRHLKSVLLVMTLYEWPVAADYHTREMTSWANGHHDMTLYTDLPEYQSGHFEAALTKDSLYMALMTAGPKATKIKAASGSSRSTSDRTYTPNGSASKVDATDTYCDHHKLHYAAALKHSSSTCRAKGGKGRG